MMYELDMELLEELLGDPVADIVQRRLLIGFKGTAEQLARNVELDYSKYGDQITSILEKPAKCTYPSHCHESESNKGLSYEKNLSHP